MVKNFKLITNYQKWIYVIKKLVRDNTQQIILETPFLTQIYTLKAYSQGIKSKIIGQEIIFRFILSLKPIEINNFQSN